MARRRVGDASAENGKNKEEEIDTCRAVYIDTNLDTHLALVVSEFDSVLDIKKKVMLEHLQCFPKLGEIRIQALKVKRKGHFYHLSDSMRVNRAFEGVKHSWFLFVDASYSKQLSENEQSCRPNMSNQSPLLCLPYNIANTECNNDDASTSAILKSASVERLSNQKAQPIPEASGREFFEVIVTNHECSGAEIKTVSADLNRVPDLPSGGTIASNIQCSDSVEPSSETGLSVKKKKQKIKKHNVDELGDCLTKENIALSHVSGGEALCHEILLSTNMVVNAEKSESKGDALLENNGLFCNPTQMTSKEATILPKGQCDSQIIALNTISPESTDADQTPLNLRIENMKSKKKRKRDEMDLPSPDDHERANIPSNLLINTEKKEHKEIGDPSKENKVPVSTSKEEIELPRNFEEQNNSANIVLDTLSSEPADTPHLRTKPDIKNKRGEKKGKKDVKRKKDVTFNLPSAAVLPLCVQDAGVDESFQEKNNFLNHVSGEDESQHEVPSAEKTEIVGTSGDASKENKVLVSTNETSTQEIEMKEKCQKIVVDTFPSAAADKLEESSGDHLEQNKGSVSKHKNSSAQEMDLKLNSVQDQDNSQNVVSDTLSPEFAESEHPGAYSDNKKLKKKKRRKMDAASTLSGANVLPSSAQNVVEEESYKEKNIALDNGSGKDESHQKVSAPANLLVNSERTELEESSGDHLEQNKGSVSKHKNSSAQEMDLKLNSLQDQENSQNVVSDTLSPELAESKHPGASSDNKKLKKKKKRKMDAASTLSGANVLPSSVQDAAGEESLKEKNIPLHEDQSRHETVTPAKSLVNAERPEQEEITRDPLEKGKDGFNATSTSIELNLDSDAAPISNTNDSVNVQSAKMMDDKSKRDQAILITPSQPAVSKSESDRIDLKHYLLSGKTEDVADSVKSGIKRSERDDKTKKKTKKSTPTLLTSHDHTLTLQSSKNLEGGVKSHNKCSSDIDPQESFSKDASSGSHPPSKKSTSNVYQKEPSSSLGPDKARTPHSVLLASGRGIFVNSTPATAYRKGKNVTPAALGSSSESFDKLDRGTKSKNRVSTADRRVVSCAKGTSEVKSRPLQKKSLLTKAGSIFKDDSSDSSDNDEASEHFNARTSSEDVLSSESDRESDINLDSPTKGSSGLDKKEDAENIEKKRSNLRNTTMDMILRSSSRYKKAKLTAESQPEVEDSESQPVDCVPDSQAI
ncbi:hypothetical protein DCAR_0727594 [Daucus carota subsp. sativus]|uniref:Uncharacterized protein n=1 Tax=Daucus carota subsp. sativus TaxID=79200 RepID=A0AAF0XJC7_DAUCS|nr:hypothetical protein DCAR_0727594 [Daucus carota subsp. sativus]